MKRYVLATILFLLIIFTTGCKKSIVGRWKSTDEANKYYYIFNSDKTCLYEMEVAKLDCTYEIDDSKLTILYNGNPNSITYSYELNKGSLIIVDENGKNNKFVREKNH